MIEITQVTDGVLVEAKGFRETFRNPFKALMAAHAVALGEASQVGLPVTIIVPTDWGDSIVIDP